MDALNNHSRIAAGIPCATTLATFLAATLLNCFAPSARAAEDHAELFANTHGALPVRWNRTIIPELRSADSCDVLMNTFHPYTYNGDKLQMRKFYSVRPGEKQVVLSINIYTCAEWQRAKNDGCSLMAPITEEKSFEESSAMLTGIPAMRSSHQSGFENEHGPLDLTRLAREILAPVQASPADLSLAIKITTSVQEKAERAAKAERCSKRRDEFKIDFENTQARIQFLQLMGFDDETLHLLGAAPEDEIDLEDTILNSSGEAEAACEAEENGCFECWELSDGTMLIHSDLYDCAQYRWANLLARGDYDGDGWEDLLFSTAGSQYKGSWRNYSLVLFTRRDNGRLMEITQRFMNDIDWQQKLPALRKWWANNCDIPADQWFTLQGTCNCSDEIGSGDRFNEKHGLHMRVKFDHGYMQGTYHCDRVGCEMPIAGALAGPVDPHRMDNDEYKKRMISHMGPTRTHVGKLDEYGIADTHTTQIPFEWGFTDGVFALTGDRSGTSQIELMGRADQRTK